MTSRARWLLLCVLFCSLISNSANAQLGNLLGTGGADEAATLSNPEFTKPVVLHIDRDGFGGAQRLRALNGVSNFGPNDLNQTGGLNDFPPCAEQGTNAGTPGIGAYIGGSNLDPGTTYRWLFDNRFFLLETYNLRYPKFASKAPATFVCPILNENVGKYLPSGQASNLHSGLDIPIGRRTLTKWTFRNRYETPVPGKGNVKVFAGAFTYKIDPMVPIVAFTGEGTATVKIYLDPDNGRWTVDSWKMQDPRVYPLSHPLQIGPVVDQGNCKVVIMDPNQTSLVSPYKGACKNGLADGNGTYKYSMDLNGFPSISTVTGEFRNGELNGKVTVVNEKVTSAGGTSITEGEYRGNRMWNATMRIVTPTGAKIERQFREGVLVAK